jgi:hypothetical protein
MWHVEPVWEKRDSYRSLMGQPKEKISYKTQREMEGSYSNEYYRNKMGVACPFK